MSAALEDVGPADRPLAVAQSLCGNVDGALGQQHLPAVRIGTPDAQLQFAAVGQVQRQVSLDPEAVAVEYKFEAARGLRPAGPASTDRAAGRE